MIVIPQTVATSKVTTGEPPNVRPIVAAQAPESVIATIVEVVRPHRSDARPPAQQPSAPSAMTRKVAALALSPA